MVRGEPGSLPVAAAGAGRAAVLGHPIRHSKSPQLHLAAYRQLGLAAGYTAVDLTSDAVPAFVREVRAEAGWMGLSVTMPLKAAMVPEMDEVTELVGTLGVLNTVVVRGSGTNPHLTGHNTDVAGIIAALRHAGVRTAPRAVILGGGGTAAAALAALAGLDAAGVTAFVRSPEKAAGLRDLGDRLGVACTLRSWESAAAGLAEADVVLSTLPPRGADPLAGEAAAMLGSGALAGAVLLDAAYDPWPSALARVWSAAGGTIVPGLEMLLYQAVEQVKLFTGVERQDWSDVINVMCDAVQAPRR